MALLDLFTKSNGSFHMSEEIHYTRQKGLMFTSHEPILAVSIPTGTAWIVRNRWIPIQLITHDHRSAVFGILRKRDNSIPCATRVRIIRNCDGISWPSALAIRRKKIAMQSLFNNELAIRLTLVNPAVNIASRHHPQNQPLSLLFSRETNCLCICSTNRLINLPKLSNIKQYLQCFKELRK